MKKAIGIDIGGAHVKIGIVDEGGNLEGKTCIACNGKTREEIRKESSISKRTLMYILKKLKEENKLIDTKFGRLTYHKIKIDEKTDL